MGFFSKKQKELALKNSNFELERAYHQSEQKLKNVSCSGDEKSLKRAMKQHGDFEYAMLYQNTPEYREKKKILNNKRR